MFFRGGKAPSDGGGGEQAPDSSDPRARALELRRRKEKKARAKEGERGAKGDEHEKEPEKGKGDEGVAWDPIDVFCKLPKRTATFHIEARHLADTSLFYDDVYAQIGPPMRREGFGIRFKGGEFVPPHGAWPEHLRPTKECNFELGQAVRGPVVDEDLVRVCAAVKSDATVVCSHIDDTHVGADDAEKFEGRILSVSELNRQQQLDKVLEALRGEDKFSLVLIDPSFGAGGSQRMMVQIVEYLKKREHYEFIEEHVGDQATSYVEKFNRKVRITYVAKRSERQTTERLPNVKLIP